MSFKGPGDAPACSGNAHPVSPASADVSPEEASAAEIPFSSDIARASGEGSDALMALASTATTESERQTAGKAPRGAKKLQPGNKNTAKYGISSRCYSTTNHHCRSICAREWAASHPEGTDAQFNAHWKKLDAHAKTVSRHNDTFPSD
jgi:hypothetical protein